MIRPLTIAAALAFLLAGCVPATPVKVNTSTIGEMPADVALNYIRGWKAPAGARAWPVNSLFKCGAIGDSSMPMKTGTAFAYPKLKLSIYVTSNTVTVRLADRSSTTNGEWCDFSMLNWDTGNATVHQRAMADLNRLATAFASLGVEIDKESSGSKP